jgi:hypothetical protein
MKRCYLAGPMTGLPDLNFPTFHAAAAHFRAGGFDVVSPAEINPDPTMKWGDAMRADIPQLCTCEVIAMLPGWEKSKGARLEHHIASELGMGVIYVNHFSQPARPEVMARIDAVERELVQEWRAERVQEVATASKPPGRWTWPWRRA